MPRNADETRDKIITAAARLFAERGVDAVSLREVNREAGQRNASALQYHFEDRAGLLRAVLAKHEADVAAIRNDLLDEIEKEGHQDLYRFAAALVLPSAEKLADRDGGRDYLRIIAELHNRYRRGSQESLGLDDTLSMRRWRAMVAPAMSPLAVQPLHSRFTARRIMYIELARRAESPRRKDDRLFVSHLIDLVTAILGAPISSQTRALVAERAAR